MSFLLAAKISSMCILGGVALVIGLLPIRLSKYFASPTSASSSTSSASKSQLFLSALACFGGGVILTTSLLEMLPEVRRHVEHNVARGAIADSGLALAEILVICGFLMIYLVEESVHAFVDWYSNRRKRMMSTKESQDNLKESERSFEKEGEGEDEAGLEIIESQNESFQGALRGFVVTLALCIHEIFEGIVLGLLQDASVVWYLTFAIAINKFVVIFCVGMRFVTSGHISTLLVVIYQTTFSLMSPIGIGIGLALTEASGKSEEELQTPTITALQGLATGTLVYIVFFEILEKERRKKSVSGLLQVTAFVLGFVLMVVVLLFEPGEDEDGVEFCTLTSEDLDSESLLPVNITCVGGVLRLLNSTTRAED